MRERYALCRASDSTTVRVIKPATTVQYSSSVHLLLQETLSESPIRIKSDLDSRTNLSGVDRHPTRNEEQARIPAQTTSELLCIVSHAFHFPRQLPLDERATRRTAVSSFRVGVLVCQRPGTKSFFEYSTGSVSYGSRELRSRCASVVERLEAMRETVADNQRMSKILHDIKALLNDLSSISDADQRCLERLLVNSQHSSAMRSKQSNVIASPSESKMHKTHATSCTQQQADRGFSEVTHTYDHRRRDAIDRRARPNCI